MKNICLSKISKLTFIVLLMGFILLTAQSGFAQTGKSGLGAVDRLNPNRNRNKNKTPQKNPDDYIGKSKKTTSNAGNFIVDITAAPSVVRVGKPYTFMAKARGGTPPYSYSWSGVNAAGSGKSTGMLSRTHMNASFKHPGITIITVRAVDANNNFAQKKVKVKVVP